MITRKVKIEVNRASITTLRHSAGALARARAVYLTLSGLRRPGKQFFPMRSLDWGIDLCKSGCEEIRVKASNFA